MNIVLYEPEIPYNTGNIGRTCVAVNSRLHLIKPLGFSLDQKEIKRAGLDYWPKLDHCEYENYGDFLDKNNHPKIWMATTKAHKLYTDVSFGLNDYIMFGPESRGIPEEILVENEETCVRIPMYEDTRSINLCNSVAIILYEALRQNDFEGLRKDGELHRLQWK
ncbi:MAG: tRNA (cytidine(34)-2'-O)-methyltransferase [Lachnospiraceae bacterium]|nr:tRNA (cytidine(34)-2'-O)-methyltransferase [Lachnospiraceae bacterium]